MIAWQERNLIILAMTIMLCIAIPVVIVAFFVGWKYRAGGKSTHLPEWTGNRWEKVGYWVFLGILVVAFSTIVWVAAHRLDPYKPIVSSQKPITIQVVALEWKWLFIYPEQNIATVNFMQIPVDTPINFRLTADAPMNSFWIPSLGGQIYSMATMETKLSLIANSIGDFPGGAAEINGKGFSGMRFVARASSREDFDKWVDKVRSSPKSLDQKTFDELNIPSEDTPAMFYSSVMPGLYNNIMIKYLMPSPSLAPKQNSKEEMNMEMK